MRILVSIALLGVVGCTGEIGAAADGAGGPEPWYERVETLPGIDPESDDPAAPGYLYDFRSESPKTGIRMLSEHEMGARFGALLPAPLDLNNVAFAAHFRGLPNIATRNTLTNVQSMSAFYGAATEAAEAYADGLLNCGGSCDNADFEAMLEAMFLRPVTAAEVAQAKSIYDEARQVGDETFARQAVVQGRLLSPHIAYRYEYGLTKKDLDQYQLAQKLSFFLTGGPPDATLLDAAAAGDLSNAQAYSEQVDRLLDSDAFGNHLAYLMELWLETTETRVDNKEADGVPGSLVPAMRAEFRAMVKKVAVDQEGTIEDLLTADSSTMSEELANHYGLDWPGGAGEQSISLEGTQRRGLLTTGLVLTANSKESGRSPMRRGAFLVHALTCSEFGKEAGVPVMVTPMGDEDLTFREKFAPLETSPVCSNCHRVLNAGFAFDVFDVVGRRFPEDEVTLEETVATFDMPPFEPIDFESPVEAVEKFATHPSVARCFMTQAWRYAEGRDPGVHDAEAFSALYQTYADDPRPVELMRSIATSEWFRFAGDLP